MNMTNRLNIRSGLVNPGMYPKFSVGTAITGELISFNVQHQQIVGAHQSRAHSWRKNESIGCRNTRAHVAESRGDTLLMQYVAGLDHVTYDQRKIHKLPFDDVEEILAAGV